MTIKIKYILTLLLLIPSIIYSADFDEVNLKEGIKNNNIEVVRKILKGKNIQTDFGLEKWGLDNSVHLTKAIEGNTCKPEIVGLLLEAGAEPSYTHLHRAAFGLCTDVTKTLLTKFDKKSKIKLNNQIIEGYENDIGGIYENIEKNPLKHGEYFTKEESKTIDGYQKLILALFKETKSQCDNGDKDYCDVIEKLKQVLKKVGVKENKAIAALKYLESPEYVVETVCKLKQELKRQKQIVNNEKRIAQKVGYENKLVVYEAGKNIITLEDAIKLIGEKYKQKTGKPLKTSKCKTGI